MHKSTNFLVTIHHTENFSFQGVIEWLDSGDKIHFRSALELMHLMEEATLKSTSSETRMRSWNNTNSLKLLKEQAI